jgi:hypothetical protein
MDVDRVCSQDTVGDLGAAGLSTHVVVLPPTMAIEVPADGGHCEDLASFCERAGVAVAEVMATLEVNDMAGLLALERDSAEAALGQMQTQEGHNASRSPQVRIAHRHDPVHTKLWPPLPLWLTATFCVYLVRLRSNRHACAGQPRMARRWLGLQALVHLPRLQMTTVVWIPELVM